MILFGSAAGLSCIFLVHVFLEFGRELHIIESFRRRVLDCGSNRCHLFQEEVCAPKILRIIQPRREFGQSL
jgi:hypothetical protein